MKADTITKDDVNDIARCKSLLHQALNQAVIHFPAHEAEPDIFVIQKWKRRAVPYHHFFPDCPVEQFIRGESVRQETHQHEISAGRIWFKPAVL